MNGVQIELNDIIIHLINGQNKDQRPEYLYRGKF